MGSSRGIVTRSVSEDEPAICFNPRLRFGLLAALCLCAVASAHAQDTVVFSSSRARSEIRLSGEVVDYTNKQLEIRVNGQVRTYPAERVKRIEFRRRPEHLDGEELYAKREFADARNRYLKALQVEGREWVRRLLFAQVVWCYSYEQQLDSAGSIFLDRIDNDPNTPYYDCIPLSWVPRPLSPGLERKALGWLADEAKRPAALLLGASHLLMSRHRAAALDQLETLSLHTDGRIAALAKAQSWRASLGKPSDRDLEDWQAELDKTPEPLRAGAYYVVGTALARRGKAEDAALSLLRVPVVYPQHRHLAARCLLDAGQQLESLGQRTEARRLYLEIVRDYPRTRDASEAKGRLNKVKE